MLAGRRLVWVDEPAQLLSMAEDLKGHPCLAFDAEMDSYFVYHTKLCLVQVSGGMTDYLIDTLILKDLSVLNEVTRNPAIKKVVHAGENDIPFFRQYGLTFENIFDTHLAAKLLELESRGLAGLVEHYFSVELSKEQQRTDWGQRPLTQEQIAYARQDTIYLCELADQMGQALRRDPQRWLEATQAFRKLQDFRVAEKVWNPDGWAKIKGAYELTGNQRGALAALYCWREEIAAREDLAHFRVAPNGLLLALARKSFSTAREVAAWGRNEWIARDSEKIFKTLLAARNSEPPSWPKPKGRLHGGMGVEEQAYYERLRIWRNSESVRRLVDPERVFSNRQLKAIAKSRPTSLKELEAIPDIEPWRLGEFGAKLLAAVSEGRS